MKRFGLFSIAAIVAAVALLAAAPPGEMPDSILAKIKIALSPQSTGYAKITTGTGNITTQAVPIPVTDGGTGATTITGLVKGNGTSAMAAATAGTDYATPTLNNGVFQARLTVATGTPVPTTDQTSKSTIYLTPYNGSSIALYSGSVWKLYTLTEISLALSSLTSGRNYDVFVYDNSGTLTLELSQAWNSDNVTRTDALALQDGVYCKSGALTRRHVGTIRTTGTTTTEDSGGVAGTTQVGAKRFVWNRYNQVPRPMNVIDTVSNFTYSTGTTRQFNGAAGNKIEFVCGDVAQFVQAKSSNYLGINTASGRAAAAGLGLDSTTAFSGVSGNYYNCGTGNSTIVGLYSGCPGLGYHYLAWNQCGSDGTCTWYGSGGGDSTQAGVQGTISN